MGYSGHPALHPFGVTVALLPWTKSLPAIWSVQTFAQAQLPVTIMAQAALSTGFRSHLVRAAGAICGLTFRQLPPQGTTREMLATDVAHQRM